MRLESTRPMLMKLSAITPEDPERMAFAAGALWTTAGMTNGALEQGATQDIAEMRQAGGEPIAFLGGLFMYHLYR